MAGREQTQGEQQQHEDLHGVVPQQRVGVGADSAVAGDELATTPAVQASTRAAGQGKPCRRTRRTPSR